MKYAKFFSVVSPTEGRASQQGHRGTGLLQPHQLGGGAHALERREGTFLGGALELRFRGGGVVAREVELGEIEIDVADAPPLVLVQLDATRSARASSTTKRPQFEVRGERAAANSP